MNMKALLLICMIFYTEGIEDRDFAILSKFIESLNISTAMEKYKRLQQNIQDDRYQVESCNQQNGLLKKDGTPETCPLAFPYYRSSVNDACDCFCKQANTSNSKDAAFPKQCHQFCGISKLVCAACREVYHCNMPTSDKLFEKEKIKKTIKKSKSRYEQYEPGVRSLNSPEALDMYYLILGQIRDNNFNSESCNQRNNIPAGIKGVPTTCPLYYPIGRKQVKKSCRCFCLKVSNTGSTKKYYPKNCYQFCGISKLVCLGCRHHIRCNYLRRSSVF